MRTSDRESVAERGSSKALAGRVSTPAGLEPHPITKYVWRTSLYASLATVLVAGAYLGFGGDKRAFQTRPVASPHGFIEHDCQRCHDTWGPAERIAATFTGETVHSVTNEKCESCHRGALHHANQFPGHEPTGESGEYLSCAKCHREHRGDVDLTYIASRHCTECHADLDEHLLANVPGHAATSPYALSIRDFEVDGGHPEFELMRLLAGEPLAKREDTVLSNLAEEEPGSSQSLAPFVTPPGKPASESVWHDPGRLRFNHYAHLRRPLPVQENRNGDGREDDDPLRDGENAERWGERMKCYEVGADSVTEVECDPRTPRMVQLRCNDCHVPDADQRYMLAIDYTEHCQVCHRIPFDTENFPNVFVPHDAIAAAGRETAATGVDVLRGYLAEKYTGKLLAKREIDPLLLIPGRPTRTLLTAVERERVQEDAERARDGLHAELDERELQELKAFQNVLGEHARGACRLCHEVTQNPEDKWKEVGKYTIEPPNVPDRWLPHSRFDHASHRDMQCGECHANERAAEGFQGVEWSAATADVLMPSIGVCRECHSQRPTHPVVGSARSDCVECHRYHDHSSDPFDMGLVPSRGPMDEGGS
jgi:hypothetical protein